MTDETKEPETVSKAELEKVLAKNQELVEQVNKLSKTLQAFGDLTPEAAKEAAEKAKEAEEAKLTAEGQFDELKKRLQAEHKTEAEKLRQEIQTRDARLEKLLLHDALDKALDEVGVISRKKEFARRYFMAEGPKLDGDVAVVTTPTGDKPLAEIVAEWAKSDAADDFIQGDAGSGSGSGNGSRGGGAKKWGDMTETERHQLATKDEAAYLRLRKEAGIPV